MRTKSFDKRKARETGNSGQKNLHGAGEENVVPDTDLRLDAVPALRGACGHGKMSMPSLLSSYSLSGPAVSILPHNSAGAPLTRSLAPEPGPPAVQQAVGGPAWVQGSRQRTELGRTGEKHYLRQWPWSWDPKDAKKVRSLGKEAGAWGGEEGTDQGRKAAGQEAEAWEHSAGSGPAGRSLCTCTAGRLEETSGGAV